MGHVFLDAYHATGDEYYYQAAEQVGAALIWGQHPTGGWNYMVDFAGDGLARLVATVGRNAWRLEEFQHYYGNATFDDQAQPTPPRSCCGCTWRSWMRARRRRARKAIQFVLDSQYPIGAWPQRFPLKHEFSKHGWPDYTSYYTFNDDVAGENIEFLIKCYQALGDPRLLDPIMRGMNASSSRSRGRRNPGWALQYTTDLKPRRRPHL